MPGPGDALSHNPTELGVVATRCFFVQLGGGWRAGAGLPARQAEASPPRQLPSAAQSPLGLFFQDLRTELVSLAGRAGLTSWSWGIWVGSPRDSPPTPLPSLALLRPERCPSHSSSLAGVSRARKGELQRRPHPCPQTTSCVFESEPRY